MYLNIRSIALNAAAAACNVFYLAQTVFVAYMHKLYMQPSSTGLSFHTSTNIAYRVEA